MSYERIKARAIEKLLYIDSDDELTVKSTTGSGDVVLKTAPQLNGAITLGSGATLMLDSDPTAALHAATKQYVDAVATGLDVKKSVRVATTANITLSGEQTIDGVAVVSGDRVLVKEQTDAEDNGIYVASTGSWTRSTDADNSPAGEVTSGMFTFVEEGSINGTHGFSLVTEDPIILGTTELDFTQFSGVGEIIAGGGLTQSGNQLDVVGTADRLTVFADHIDIASTYVGQGSITTVGTITSGTWNATTIAVNKGGTGLTSFTTGDLLYASSPSAFSPLNIGANNSVLISNGTIPSWSTSPTLSSLSLTGSLNIVTSIIYNTDHFQILSNTVDGSDNRRISINGGGGASETRGGRIILFGNEYATTPGYVTLIPGTGAIVDVQGALTTSGVLTASVGVQFGLGTSVAGRIFTTAASGLVARGITGSSYDFVVRSANDGSNVLQVPTGTGNIEFPGAVLVTGNFTGSGNWIYTATDHLILANTSDGNDNKKIIIGGGGGASDTRGGRIDVSGNEHASTAGQIRLIPGSSGFLSIIGTTTASGLITAQGGLLFNTHQSTAQGKINYDSSNGLTVRGITGSSYDFILYSADAGGLILNPTATRNLTVGHSSGTVTFPGTTVFSGATAANRVVITNASNQITTSGNLTWNGSTLAVTGTTTISGNVSLGTNSASGYTLSLNSAATNNRSISYQTAGVSRWLVGANNDAESGSNVGSDYRIARYNDAGTFIDNALLISRPTGAVTLSTTLRTIGNAAIAASTNGSIALNIGQTTWTGGSTTQYGIVSDSTFDSVATNAGIALEARVKTAVASFTMTSAMALRVLNASKGAGSTITTLYGLKVEDQTQGTTNYAIHTSSGLVRFGGITTIEGTGEGILLNRNTGSGYLTWQDGSGNNRWVIQRNTPNSGNLALHANSQTGASSRFYILNSSSGTATAIFDTENLRVGIGNNTPPLHELHISKSSVGSHVVSSIYNTDNTDGASSARLFIASGGASGGDAYIGFQVSGVNEWSVGLDNSDSDALVFSFGNTIGTNNRMKIETGGAVTMSSTLAVTGGVDITGRVGIGAGGIPSSTALDIKQSSFTGSSQWGIVLGPVFTSAATVSMSGAYVQLTSEAATYTTTNVYGVRIDNPVKGAGHTMSTLYGLKIENQTQGGTNYAIHTGSGLVQFGGNVGLGVSPTADLHIAKSSAGSNVTTFVHNTDNTNAASNARLLLQTGGSSSGDPYASFLITGAASWSLGVDNSDSDAFVVSEAATLGSSNRLRIASGGAVTIPGTLGVMGAITATGGIAFNGGGTNLNHYEEGTFTGTLNGFSGSVNGTCRYIRVGKIVTLYIPSMTGTSNSTSMYLSGIPSAIAASRSQAALVFRASDNSSDVQGYAYVTASPDISFFIISPTGVSNWTNSGIKGIQDPIVISYTLQ